VDGPATATGASRSFLWPRGEIAASLPPRDWPEPRGQRRAGPRLVDAGERTLAVRKRPPRQRTKRYRGGVKGTLRLAGLWCGSRLLIVIDDHLSVLGSLLPAVGPTEKWRRWGIVGPTELKAVCVEVASMRPSCTAP
jgi:hypothetical protein